MTDTYVHTVSLVRLEQLRQTQVVIVWETVILMYSTECVLICVYSKVNFLHIVRIQNHIHISQEQLIRSEKGVKISGGELYV